jgi:hypothetical protein
VALLLVAASFTACTDECDVDSDCATLATDGRTYACIDNECVARTVDGGTTGDGGTDAGQVQDGGTSDGGTDAGTGGDGGVTVRILHAAPDAPAVDVYAQGQSTPLATNVAYRATSAWITVPAGTVTVELRPTGAAASSAPAFTSAPLALQAGERVTAMAAGLLASTDPAAQLRVVPLVERFGTPSAGNARVRVVHAGVDAPAVDLDVGDDGTAEITGLERFTDTGEEGVGLPASTSLQLGIRAGGSRVTAFTLPALADGAEYLAVATGQLSEPPSSPRGFGILVVDENGVVGTVLQNPRAHILHASPDAPAVDAYVGAQEIADNVTYGLLAPPVQVPPGSYTVDLFAHEAGSTRPAASPAFTAGTGALEAGKEYLVLVAGFLAAPRTPPLQLIALEAGFVPQGTDALVRAVNASPDAPALDFGPVSSGQLAPTSGLASVAFGSASAAAGAPINATTATWGSAPTGTTAPLATVSLDLTSSSRVFLVAAGLVTPGANEPAFQLWRVDTYGSTWSAQVMPGMP